MSFFDEIKQKSQTEQNQKSNLQSRCLPPRLHRLLLNLPPQLPFCRSACRIVQEELKTLRKRIRQDARSRKYQTVGGSIFRWNPPLARGRLPSRSSLLTKLLSVSISRPDAGKILTQSKRLFSGYLPRGTLYAFQKDGTPFISVF